MRPHKYGAVGCREVYRDCPHGHASLKEHRRWMELVLLERAGEIQQLQQQVRMNLCESVNGECRHLRPLVYVADFAYLERCAGSGEWRQVYEDAKGVQTPVFKLKRHLLEDQGVALRLT